VFFWPERETSCDGVFPQRVRALLLSIWAQSPRDVSVYAEIEVVLKSPDFWAFGGGAWRCGVNARIGSQLLDGSREISRSMARLKPWAPSPRPRPQKRDMGHPANASRPYVLRDAGLYSGQTGKGMPVSHRLAKCAAGTGQLKR